jgi:hypothetical protein
MDPKVIFMYCGENILFMTTAFEKWDLLGCFTHGVVEKIP